MDVAVVSVISSGLVAVGSLALQWRNGAEQRRHDATQAFEARAWELKAPGHLDLLATLGRIRDRASDGYEVARGTSGWLNDLYVAQAVIVAYGTDECRRDLDALIQFIEALKPGTTKVGTFIRRAQRASEEVHEAVNDKDPQAVDVAARKLRASRGRVRDAFAYDGVKLAALNDKLIASTRSSLRGGL